MNVNNSMRSLSGVEVSTLNLRDNARFDFALRPGRNSGFADLIALVVSTLFNIRVQHPAQQCVPCTSVHDCEFQFLYASTISVSVSSAVK
jgi:hypothetical protein